MISVIGECDREMALVVVADRIQAALAAGVRVVTNFDRWWDVPNVFAFDPHLSDLVDGLPFWEKCDMPALVVIDERAVLLDSLSNLERARVFRSWVKQSRRFGHDILLVNRAQCLWGAGLCGVVRRQASRVVLAEKRNVFWWWHCIVAEFADECMLHQLASRSFSSGACRRLLDGFSEMELSDVVNGNTGAPAT